MAFIRGANVVTDGLVLALDAANPKSYVSGSNVWRDLTNNNYNLTLSDSGTSWNNAGYFSLNDSWSATYNGVITTSSTCTMVFWIQSLDLQSLFWEGQSSSYYIGAYRVGNKEYYSNAGGPNFYMDTIDYPNIYDYFPNTSWHMVEFKNINFSSWTANKFNTYTSYKFENGFCAAIMMYNRNLTLQESIQNYNATKARFGIE